MIRISSSYTFVTAALAVLLLAGCGPGGLRGAKLPASTIFTDNANTTGATADDGHPFTAYDTTKNVQDLVSQVKDTDANREFAAQIETATVIPPSATSDPNTPPTLEVDVQLKNIGASLQFKGAIEPKDTSYYATLNESTGQRPDLTMTAACADAQCNHGNYLLFDLDNHQAAIIITREDRVIKLKTATVPMVQTNGVSTPSTPDETQVANEYKDGQPVVVTSTQIFPGRSYFEIQGKSANGSQPAIDIKGNLEEPDGDCPALQVNDPSQQLGQACLIGNDEQGDLLLRVTPKDDPQDDYVQDETSNPPAAQPAPTTPTAPAAPTAPTTSAQTQQGTPSKNSQSTGKSNTGKNTNTKNPPAPAKPATPPAKAQAQKRGSPLFLELLPREDDDTNTTTSNQPLPPAPVKNTNPPPVATNGCPTPESPNVNPQAKPLLDRIMEDCTNPYVVEYINKVWGPSGKHEKEIITFLNLAAGVPSPNKDHQGSPKQFQNMLTILDQNNFPQIMAFVTLDESNFNPKAIGHDGERGIWQFMPGTADKYNLSLPPEGQAVPVEASTVAFTKYFNYLLGEWDQDFKMALSSYNQGEGTMNKTVAKAQVHWLNDPSIPQAEKEAYGLTHDFWYLYKHYIIKETNGYYVPQILAAIFVGANPQAYGHDASVTGLEMK